MKKLFFTDRIEVVSINTTPICNMACPYCIMNSDYNRYPHGDKERLIKSLETFIGNFSNNFVDLKLDILGGEPLCELEHTIKIIEMFKPYAKQFLLATNGEFLGDKDILDKLHKADPEISFYIGFDTTQKSVFRFNKTQKDAISLLGNRHKVHGFYVIEGKDEVKHIAEHVKAITELTRTFPKVEYNFLKLNELRENENILDEIKNQLDSIPYAELRCVMDDKYDECTCGIVNFSADGTVFSCSDDVQLDYSFAEARKFKEEHCPSCSMQQYCCACPIEISRYKGDLFCKCVAVFKERI